MADGTDFSINITGNAAESANKIADTVLRIADAAEKTAQALEQQLARAASDAADKTAKAADKAAASKTKAAEREAAKTQKVAEKLAAAEQSAQAKSVKAAEKAAEQKGKAAEKAAKVAEKASEKAAEAAKKGSFLGTLQENTSFSKLTGAATLGNLLADGLIEGAKKAAELITEGIKFAFEAAGKEEQVRNAYKLTLGDAGTKEALEQADKYSKGTRFTGNQVADQLRPLFTAGFKPGVESANAYSLAGDLAAAQGTTGQGGVQSNVELLSKIKLGGGISSKQLKNLGISSDDFYKEFGNSIGVNGNTKAGRAAATKAAEGGFDSDRIIHALETIVANKNGGALGVGAKLDANSFEGQFEKLKSLPETFFARLVESPGFQTFKDTLTKVLEQLDPDSPNGQAILGGLEEAFNTIAGIVKDAFNPDNIESFKLGVREVVDASKSLLEFLGDVWKITKLIASVFEGPLFDSVRAAANDIALAAKGLGYISDIAQGKGINLNEETEGHSENAEAPGPRVSRSNNLVSGGASVTVNNNTTVNGATGENAGDIGTKIADSSHKQAVDAWERTRQQMGAGRQ